MRIVIILLLAGVAHAKPEFKATLCQSWSKTGQPAAITDQFFTDNTSVRLHLLAKAAVETGHKLHPVITMGSTRIALGNSQTTNGKSNIYGFGIRLAGTAWARIGGKFQFRIYWDDEKEPLVSVPFTIQVANRWALLVGISDYPPKGKGGPDLDASALDAERMRDLLVGSFGFQPDHVMLVTDLDATSVRLRKELTAMADKAGPNDAVIFYYCGHGTQIPDLNGDEPDGWDEALATADVKPPMLTTEEDLKLVLSDDDIGELLGRFKTKNVTVIFDSCHSGTAVRAGEGVQHVDAEGIYLPMSDEQNVGRKLVEKAQNARRKASKPKPDGLDVDQGYVFLSGARSWETGQTAPDGCFFSRELRAAMLNADGQSWDEIMHVVRPRVQRWNLGQSPQVEGASRRYPFSLTEAPADAAYERPTLAAIGGIDPARPQTLLAIAKKGKVALVSGQTSLADSTKGVVCDVFARGTRVKRGRVRLTGTMQAWQRAPGKVAYFAAAEVLSGEMHRGDRLVPTTMRVPNAKPSLGFTFLKHTTAQQQSAMMKTVKAFVRLLQADVTVRVPRGSLAGMDYIVFPELRNGKVMATVVTPTSVPVGTSTGSVREIAAGIQKLVKTRHDQFARFNRISNPSPAFRCRTVVIGSEHRTAGENIGCRVSIDKPAHIYVLTAMEGQKPFFLVESVGRHDPATEFKFEFATKAGTKGSLFVKVIASEKPLSLKGVQGAEALQKELRRVYPAGSGGDAFIATDGWADTVVRIDYR